MRQRSRRCEPWPKTCRAEEPVAEVRARSENSSARPPFESFHPEPSCRKLARTRGFSPSARLRFPQPEFPQFPQRGGERILDRATPGSPPSPEPELPGEFVSDDLRADCARFLSEQRALIGRRRELSPESSAWVPRRGNPACPDVIAEGRGGAAAQSPPNSRSARPGQ
jgi:hypothetical protein